MTQYLTTKEAADYIRCSASYLNKLRVYGSGPKFIRVGRLVVYEPQDIDEWMRKSKVKP